MLKHSENSIWTEAKTLLKKVGSFFKRTLGDDVTVTLVNVFSSSYYITLGVMVFLMTSNVLAMLILITPALMSYVVTTSRGLLYEPIS